MEALVKYLPCLPFLLMVIKSLKKVLASFGLLAL